MGRYFTIAVCQHSPAGHSQVLALTMTVGLLLLTFFGCANFLCARFMVPLTIPLLSTFKTDSTLTTFGRHALPLVDRVILPINVSFCAFRTVTCMISATGSGYEPTGDYVSFVGCLTFFPGLTTNPVTHPKSLLPRVRALPSRAGIVSANGTAFLVVNKLFGGAIVTG